MPENRRVFNLSAHKALWTWLAEHPDKWKEDWTGWKENGGEYECINNCFACQYAEVKLKSTPSMVSHFENCPIDWGTETKDEESCGFVCENSGIYDEWHENSFGDDTYRSSLAKRIANLKVKKGVKTI